MSGSGMKQGQQVRCGSKRQEVAKTWRRRRGGCGKPVSFMPLHWTGIRCRGRNLMGGAADAPHYGAGRRGGSTFGCALKESASPREEPWKLSREQLQGPRNAKTS
jgi:hypothetical protein